MLWSAIRQCCSCLSLPQPFSAMPYTFLPSASWWAHTRWPYRMSAGEQAEGRQTSPNGGCCEFPPAVPAAQQQARVSPEWSWNAKEAGRGVHLTRVSRGGFGQWKQDTETTRAAERLDFTAAAGAGAGKGAAKTARWLCFTRFQLAADMWVGCLIFSMSSKLNVLFALNSWKEIKDLLNKRRVCCVK